MTDRELLELAAKAAGYDKLCWWDEKLQYMWDAEGFDFDPLGDDGDALRLAVKLNIHIAIDCESSGSVEVSWDYDESGNARSVLQEDALFGDDYAATRRAITRAAAEIGKTL